jgi:hypothetical protein
MTFMSNALPSRSPRVDLGEVNLPRIRYKPETGFRKETRFLVKTVAPLFQLFDNPPVAFTPKRVENGEDNPAA